MYADIAIARPAEEAQLPGMGNVEPVVQHLLGDGKDRGVGADGQGQRARRDGREARALSQEAEAVANVAAQPVPWA